MQGNESYLKDVINNMKYIDFALGALLSMVALEIASFTGCSSTGQSAQPSIPAQAAVPEHSMRTVIVSLEHQMSDDEVEALAADYGLNVVYNYSSFNMCALASDVDLTEKQLINLMDRLSEDSRVLSVDRDYIMHLD